MANSIPKPHRACHVAVCACTYQRPEGLNNLLAGLATQRFTAIPQPLISIVIADNEACETTAQICHDFSRDTGIPLIYVPVAKRGISYARNACLDQLPKDTDLLAFIDDDERPEPGWLEALLVMQKQTGSDVVYGPVSPIFPEATPRWIQESDFFAKPNQADTLHNGQEIAFAATCNCLMKVAIIHDTTIRFDPEFALCGGEDKLFFRQIKAAGYRIVWTAQARVRETVPPQRACLRYLLQASFRLGNVRLPVKLRLLTSAEATHPAAQLRTKTLLKSLSYILSGSGTLLAVGLSPSLRQAQKSTGACKIAEGLGMLASLAGFSYRHYR